MDQANNIRKQQYNSKRLHRQLKGGREREGMNFGSKITYKIIIANLSDEPQGKSQPQPSAVQCKAIRQGGPNRKRHPRNQIILRPLRQEAHRLHQFQITQGRAAVPRRRGEKQGHLPGHPRPRQRGQRQDRVLTISAPAHPQANQGRHSLKRQPHLLALRHPADRLHRRKRPQDRRQGDAPQPHRARYLAHGQDGRLRPRRFRIALGLPAPLLAVQPGLTLMVHHLRRMNIYQSLRIFPLNVLNALHDAEVLPGAVLLHHEQAAGVHETGVHIHHEVLEALDLGLPVVVVPQQFLDQVGLGLLEGDVVGVAAEDVLELALQLVDIVVVLSSELKFHLFVLRLDPFLLFCSLIEILSQVVNDPAVVVSVLLPKDAQLVLIRFAHVQDGVPDLQALLDQRLEIGLVVVLDVDGEVALGFVEPDIG